MNTPHTPEDTIVEAFWKMLASNQFVKSTNSVTDKVEEHPPAIVDMEAIVAIHGEFDKYAIDEWLTTYGEAQKAEAYANVGALRQWINEDRIISNPTRQLVTNEDILFWLTGEEKYLPHKDTEVSNK